MTRAYAIGGRVLGFWSLEVLDHVCGVGFIKRCLDLPDLKGEARIA